MSIPQDPDFGLASRSFDGISTYASATIVNNLGFGWVGSISMWVKDASGGGTFMTTARTGSSMGNITLQGSGGTLQFRINSRQDAPYGYNVIHGDPIPVDEWVHVVAVVDDTADDYSLYINGVGSHGLQMNRIADHTDGDFREVNFSRSHNHTWGTTFNSCQVANARIWNRKISPEEVGVLYGNGTISDASLIGAWIGNLNNLTDYGPNSDHLTNYGSTYSTDGPFN